MFHKLWKDWFSNPAAPLPTEPPTFENAAHDELEVVIVSVFHHENICYLPDPPPHWSMQMGAGPDKFERTRILDIPLLVPEAQKWLDDHTPGYTYRQSRVLNTMLEITFANRNDAVKFKLFWM